MKRSHPKSESVKASTAKEPVRTLLRQEGKLVHGTKGKPTRGPRGNKR
jgi:hypothetical protein